MVLRQKVGIFPQVMGGPTLEIARMAMYVFMPVATFYYFNLPEVCLPHIVHANAYMLNTAVLPVPCQDEAGWS